MRPTRQRSTTGTLPITCHGRSAPFGAQRGWRCWSRTEPAVHYTFYEFADVEEARELTDSDKIKPLIADLDRVWGNRVSRRREILEIVQEIVS